MGQPPGPVAQLSTSAVAICAAGAATTLCALLVARLRAAGRADTGAHIDALEP
ncbi:hypothetical protein [Actinoplanes siamensis]|uniref:hypothetical protein n=1 Tax=Actinoplanes siamensis TaxID=1223317 RepID=UPI001945B026|nr:hypothetical protein [Actinoplanes siamensis]